MNAAIAMKFEMMELGDYVVEMKNILEKQKGKDVSKAVNYLCVIYSVVNNKVNNNAPLTEIERKSLTDIKHKVLEHRKLV